jgi:Transposase DDE domain
MEGELWGQVYALIARLGKGKGVVRGQFLDVEIAAVYLWSVLHDRPVCWACQRRHWPRFCPLTRLPSPPTMSRRLRSAGVQLLLRCAERELHQQGRASWLRIIDGKPLPVAGHSEAEGVGYGRAASSMARGYKFHGVFDPRQGFIAWRIKPMNVNESRVAHELISELRPGGYLVGDNQFDQNPIYETAGQRSIQLVAPRRKNVKGLGHMRHSSHRLRAIELLSGPFGQSLLRARRTIESAYAQLTGLAFGLAPLPNWVRTPRRVENWVRAKLIFFTAYLRKTTTSVV